MYKEIDGNISIEHAKALLKIYLQNQVAEYRQHPERHAEIAYRIAGLLSIDKLRRLPDDDSYMRILDMAATLEIPEVNEGPDSWPSLIEAVNQL